MGELSFENIMSGDEIENLFADSDEETAAPEIEGTEDKENKEITEKDGFYLPGRGSTLDYSSARS